MKILEYLRDVQTEIKHTTWPSKEATIRMTTTVLLVSAAVGLYIGGLDSLFTFTLNALLLK